MCENGLKFGKGNEQGKSQAGETENVTVVGHFLRFRQRFGEATGRVERGRGYLVYIFVTCGSANVPKSAFCGT